MGLVIPVFIPHQGCPHACIFCNQHRISGQGVEVMVTPARVGDTIERWLGRSRLRAQDRVQVAFYGGSFTGLPLSRQRELLLAAAPFLESGHVRSLRLSTRPDYVDAETVDFLRAHGVATVELGVQSLDDEVLAVSRRGHDAATTRRAVRFLRQGGMEVGFQLMLGLPGQSTRSLVRTVREAADLQPDFVRIYPVLVLRESRLYSLYERGDYQPLSLGKAVVLAAWMKKYFDVRKIRVVRIGLQPGPELEQSLVAGPYHPAFGELVGARIMFNKTRKLLARLEKGARVILIINGKDQSIFRGIRSANMQRLSQLGLLDRFCLQKDESLPRHSVKMTANPEPQTVSESSIHAQRQ